MSVLSKTLIAVGLAVALSGVAHADSSVWVLRSDMGYVVDMKGNTMTVTLPKMTRKMMSHAHAVPRGTVFFMHDGKLMMMYDRNTAAMAQ